MRVDLRSPWNSFVKTNQDEKNIEVYIEFLCYNKSTLNFYVIIEVWYKSAATNSEP